MYNWKKLINVALKSETDQLFWGIFLQIDHLLWDERNKNENLI